MNGLAAMTLNEGSEELVVEMDKSCGRLCNRKPRTTLAPEMNSSA